MLFPSRSLIKSLGSNLTLQGDNIPTPTLPQVGGRILSYNDSSKVGNRIFLINQSFKIPPNPSLGGHRGYFSPTLPKKGGRIQTNLIIPEVWLIHSPYFPSILILVNIFPLQGDTGGKVFRGTQGVKSPPSS